MKKLIALLLALILVFSFAACKKEAPVADSGEQVEAGATEEENVAEPEEEPEPDRSHDLPIVLEDGTMLNPDGTPYDAGNETDAEVEEETDIEVEEENEAPAADNAAATVLKTIWDTYGDGEKFAIIGGNMEAGIMDVPGVWDMNYKDGLTNTLLIPAEQLANVTEAATMIHMMNTNTFSGGIVKLADGTDVAAFAQAVRDAIQSNQWLCGMPEKMMISDMGSGFVMIAYGLNDTMSVFEGKVADMYPDAQSLFNEAIGG